MKMAGIFTQTLDDSSSVVDNFAVTASMSLSNGTGASKAQIQYHNQLSLLTNTSVELDLRALVTAFGVAVMSKVKMMAVQVITETSGYTVEVGGAASNAWEACFGAAGDVVIVGAKSCLMLGNVIDGLTVDASHKQLKFHNPAGGTVTFKVWIIGEGAMA
jgi:hypothetical protein